jgi:hypothetical protein
VIIKVVKRSNRKIIKLTKNKMEEKIKQLEEQINFLKDAIRIGGTIPNLNDMFEDWKNKRGIFRSNKL